MPTLTQKARPTGPAAALDLATLEHLHAHPALAPLLSRRVTLRARLEEINGAVVQARRELHQTQHGEGFSALSAQRTLKSRLAALEEKGAQVEAELTPLHGDIERMKEHIKAQLRPPLAEEGAQVMAALLAALEQLAVATEAYMTYYRRCQRLLEASLVPLMAVPAVAMFIRRTRQTLERLQADSK